MVSLSEVFEPKGAYTPFVIPTYSASEGGNMDLTYQLGMTVNATVQNPAKREMLVNYVKNTMGYDTCDIDSRNNTVRVYNLGGLNTSAILKFIKKTIDKNATVQRTE
ncbi:hypothetical protein M758_10G089300 [Ceratodon purpureus]|uniref:Uncharacterized protein n=1 Tax=Ceratodon purpureus TaxID=3225 RepID=A0A8T0GL14_CERPU|nr:hypothetical protein KC19_10G090900 [Ceratodon purpureus]KAG0603381.1 hypothetical protein M758_10G089300 [Ceratodon purpureus]